MKIKVVGWTQYDLHEFDEGDSGWAVRMAVVDDIRKNGYLFSGYAHQEYSNCAPVFNDGKMRRFSQRGFADMMAEAHGDTDYMAYSLYMFGLNEEQCRYPQNEVYKNDVQVEKDLAETFVLPVDEKFFAGAPTIERFHEIKHVKKTIKLPDLPELRYIEKGDTLVLTCNGKSSAFGVLEVERDRNLTHEEDWKFRMYISDCDNSADKEAAIKKFMDLPVIITLRVKQLRKFQFKD